MFLLGGILAFGISLILTPLVRRFSAARGILDVPGVDRKKHRGPTPLLGGFAIFFSFWAVLGAFSFFLPIFFWRSVSPQQLLGVFLGSAALMIFGYFDDKYSLRPHIQIWGPILAAALALVFGVGARFITNPLGGILRLDFYQLNIEWLGLWPVFPANVIAFVWLTGTMYTMKILDGLDGLVSGIAAIGGLLIFLFATITRYTQSDAALVSIIFTGSALGFLVWNFYPAKIFLGEGGSLFCGFMLGVLAVIAGGKIAIALLVIGIPALDLVWVVCRRVFWERRSFALADRGHLHYRLLDIGLSERQAVLTLCLFSFLFGVIALFLPSRGKLLALGILIAAMIILSIVTISRSKKDKSG